MVARIFHWLTHVHEWEESRRRTRTRWMDYTQEQMKGLSRFNGPVARGPNGESGEWVTIGYIQELKCKTCGNMKSVTL